MMRDGFSKRLGRLADGAPFFYDEERVEFASSSGPLTLADVRALDAAGCIRWRFLEQRDWMRRLDAQAFEAAAAAAREARGLFAEGMSEKDREIAEHVRKDNSYIHGRIVDADAQAEQRQRAQRDGEGKEQEEQ